MSWSLPTWEKSLEIHLSILLSIKSINLLYSLIFRSLDIKAIPSMLLKSPLEKKVIDLANCVGFWVPLEKKILYFPWLTISLVALENSFRAPSYTFKDCVLTLQYDKRLSTYVRWETPSMSWTMYSLKWPLNHSIINNNWKSFHHQRKQIRRCGIPFPYISPSKHFVGR